MQEKQGVIDCLFFALRSASISGTLKTCYAFSEVIAMCELKTAQKEWAKWKYYVMARSQSAYLELRQLFSGNQWSQEKEVQFKQQISNVKKLSFNLKARRNAYEHVWGYFKKIATAQERATFFRLSQAMTAKQDEALPYLKQLAEKYQITYLLDSHFFD